MKRSIRHSSLNTHHSSLNAHHSPVPALRFPEFRNAGPWEVKRLGEVLLESRVPSTRSDPRRRITVRLHLQGVEHREYRGTEAQNATQFFVRSQGQFIYGKQNFHKGAFGIIPKELHGFESSSDIPAFDFTATSVSEFVFYYLSRESVYTAFEERMTGTGSKRLHPRVFLRSSICMPTLPEQRKIADCLSSLDELITVETQKLEALKAHKKGLMQQLFPEVPDPSSLTTHHSPFIIQNSCTPRLRFPEFRNAGPWANYQVSEFGTIVTGKTPSTSNPKYWNGRFVWVTPTDISDAKYIYKTERLITNEGAHSIGVLPENTVLITCIASIGKNAILKVPGSCNQQINAIIPNKDFNPDFLYYLFGRNQILLQNQAGTSATAIIPKSSFEKLYLHAPELPEQRKIADCLSSLDELIDLQARKIELLQAHKKGLMQQLFPSAEL